MATLALVFGALHRSTFFSIFLLSLSPQVTNLPLNPSTNSNIYLKDHHPLIPSTSQYQLHWLWCKCTTILCILAKS